MNYESCRFIVSMVCGRTWLKTVSLLSNYVPFIGTLGKLIIGMISLSDFCWRLSLLPANLFQNVEIWVRRTTDWCNRSRVYNMYLVNSVKTAPSFISYLFPLIGWELGFARLTFGLVSFSHWTLSRFGLWPFIYICWAKSWYS